MNRPKASGATEKCLTCKGHGRYVMAVDVAGAEGDRRESFEVSCLMCKAAGFLPLGYQAEYQKASEAFWCSCGEQGTSGDFHDDGTCGMCAKHHWHCATCGKIAQVG